MGWGGWMAPTLWALSPPSLLGTPRPLSVPLPACVLEASHPQPPCPLLGQALLSGATWPAVCVSLALLLAQNPT